MFVPALKTCFNARCPDQLKNFASCALFYVSYFSPCRFTTPRDLRPLVFTQCLYEVFPSPAVCSHFQLHYRFKFPTYVNALGVWTLHSGERITNFSCLLLPFSSSDISVEAQYSVHVSTNILYNFKHSPLGIILLTYCKLFDKSSQPSR
jgi:hypothetical protein